jgi:hypothetical protein
MFDPTRDVDDSLGFWWRLLLLALLTLAMGCAILPSATRFSVGVDEKSCTAIVNGLHADHSPTAADRVINSAFLGLHPTQQQQEAITRSNARFDWLTGPGACVPESRHRLILSGIGLGLVALLAGGVTIGQMWMRKTKAGSRSTRGHSTAEPDTAQRANA